jgi:plasmid stability protein
MPELVVSDVPAEIVEALQRRAASAGTSAEAEHRRILEDALRTPHRDFWEKAARLRAEIGRLDVDTTDIIRFYRDTR